MDETISDSDKIQKDLLWGLYQEFRNHARHCETLRSNVSNYVLVIASALITVITFDGQINRYDLPLSLIIVFTGLFGTLFAISFTDRYYRNRRQALELIDRLDTLFFEEKSDMTIAYIRKRAFNKHDRYESFKLIREIAKTQLLWAVFPLLLAVLGVVLAILSWLGG